MKKETEFEPALRQVISQTFIDTPAPRKTRYRIIHPDLNTLKNAEDNLSIVLLSYNPSEPVFNAKSDYLTTESYSATTPQPPPNAL